MAPAHWLFLCVLLVATIANPQPDTSPQSQRHVSAHSDAPQGVPRQANTDDRTRAADALVHQSRFPEAQELAQGLVLEDPTNANARLVLAVALHQLGRLDEALQHYEIAQAQMGDKGFLLVNMGLALFDLGAFERSFQALYNAIQRHGEGKSVVALNAAGIALHRLAKDADAIPFYNRAIELDPEYNRGELFFNRGVSLQRTGDHQSAIDNYQQALAIDPNMGNALMNLAAIYHEHMHLEEAIALYTRIVKLHTDHVSEQTRGMARVNMAVASIEQGNSHLAIQLLSSAIQDHREQDDTSDIYYTQLIMLAKRVVCDWSEYEQHLDWIVSQVRSRELAHKKPPSLLPFDSLLLPVSPAFRLQVAKAHARQFPAKDPSYHAALLDATPKTLSIGYLSYDYADHPTAHLVEALFSEHNRSRITAVALAYGKDNESGYRRRIEDSSDAFLNLAGVDHEQSIARIVDNEVHVVMDMQGFTRGGRPQICAGRPAPIIVNYLVFPGSSGSGFTDYFIGDAAIVPAEHAGHFTEKIVYMPDTYQVNYYAVHEHASKGLEFELKTLCDEVGERCDWLKRLGEPRRPFVFCNFNKNDKLDPRSFHAWMLIMKRVPNSTLWLLEPSRGPAAATTKRNIRNASARHGVASERILFAPRVSKAVHLRRHRFADLFIDTLVYGAHSTATDALKGGVPLLTVQGDSVANRVGVSLIRSLNIPSLRHLIAEDETTFVEIAVYLGHHRAVLATLKQDLINGAAVAPLFDARRYTSHLERAFQGMWEVARFKFGGMHVVV